MFRHRRTAIFFLLATLPVAARAEAPAAADSCVTYDPAYGLAPLMKVGAVAGGRLYLQDRARACPASGACAWRRAAYLTPGDTVLVSALRDGFRCIYYGTARGKLIAGFVPAAALQPAPDVAGPDPAFLAGLWREDGGDEIRFVHVGAGVRAKGQAHFGENSGEFDGAVKLSGSGFAVEDGGCRVDARRRGPYLFVSDNNGCGGFNVSFAGIYSRSR